MSNRRSWTAVCLLVGLVSCGGKTLEPAGGTGGGGSSNDGTSPTEVAGRGDTGGGFQIVYPTCRVIRASDYDQSCSTSQECSPVWVGAVSLSGGRCILPCECPNAIINLNALPGYLKDLPQPPVDFVACCSSGVISPVCWNGRCQAGQPLPSINTACDACLSSTKCESATGNIPAPTCAGDVNCQMAYAQFVTCFKGNGQTAAAFKLCASTAPPVANDIVNCLGDTAGCERVCVAPIDAGSDGATCATIRASDYDQTCKTSQDCALVFEGDPCGQTACPNAPINRAATTAYNAVLAVRRPVSLGPPGGTCYGSPPICKDGVCQMCPNTGCPYSPTL